MISPYVSFTMFYHKSYIETSTKEVPARFVCIFALAKIIVATSLRTGGSNSPPDCCIYGLQIWLDGISKQKRTSVWMSFLFGGTGQI